MEGKSAFADLGSLLHGTARKAVADAARIPPVDAGTVMSGGVLVLDSLTKLRFAPGEYMTLRHNLLPNPMTDTNPTAVGDHGTHIHTVIRPPELLDQPEYLPGTRVLVILLWGTRPVIVGALP